MREGKFIKSGGERKVYEDLDHPDRLIKVAHNYLEEAPNFIKARFYLTKILHLLFPKNIPDMKAASFHPNKLVVERKAPSRKTLDGRKREDSLRRSLGALGIILDPYEGNFIEEKEGSVCYVDSIDPWMDTGSNLQPQFSESGLREAIMTSIVDPADQRSALSHLNRLKEILKKESETRNNR